MSLSKEVKPRTLAFKATNEFHANVKEFCDKRMWNMSAFLERAVEESMAKVLKNENRNK